MDINLFLLAFPSAIVLAIKIWLFFYARHTLINENRVLGVFLAALLLLNLSELIGYNYLQDIPNALTPLLCYYAALICTIYAFVNLSASMSGVLWLYRPVVQGVLAVILVILMFGSEQLIAGVQSIGYSYTRVPGPYYWVLPLYIVINLLLAIALLCFGVFRHDERIMRRRCLVVLLGFLPTVLVMFLIIALMTLGYKMNASVLISITTTIFLLVLIVTENKLSLFNLLRKIPFTEENRRLNEGYAVLSEILYTAYLDKPMQLKERLKTLEDIVVRLSVENTGGNQAQAAKKLGISRSTINRRVNKTDG